MTTPVRDDNLPLLHVSHEGNRLLIAGNPKGLELLIRVAQVAHISPYADAYATPSCDAGQLICMMPLPAAGAPLPMATGEAMEDAISEMVDYYKTECGTDICDSFNLDVSAAAAETAVTGERHAGR